MRKIRLNNLMLRVAACFVDYESAQLVPTSRIVEYGYVYGKLMDLKPQRALDVGCVALHNYISPALAMNGCQTWGVDIRKEWGFKHPNFHFVQGDIRNPLLFGEKFDTIFCISTLEHIGLPGYYGNTLYDKFGDVHAVHGMRSCLRDGGTLILTVPYKDTFLERPGARVYDRPTIQKLLNTFAITNYVIYKLEKDNWVQVENTESEGVICLTAVKRQP